MTIPGARFDLAYISVIELLDLLDRIRHPLLSLNWSHFSFFTKLLFWLAHNKIFIIIIIIIII